MNDASENESSGMGNVFVIRWMWKSFVDNGCSFYSLTQSAIWSEHINYVESNLFQLDYDINHDLLVGLQEIEYFYL